VAGNVVLELKLKALILDTIHAVDVIEQIMQEQVTRVEQWEWNKQLRYTSLWLFSGFWLHCFGSGCSGPCIGDPWFDTQLRRKPLDQLKNSDWKSDVFRRCADWTFALEYSAWLDTWRTELPESEGMHWLILACGQTNRDIQFYSSLLTCSLRVIKCYDGHPNSIRWHLFAGSTWERIRTVLCAWSMQNFTTLMSIRVMLLSWYTHHSRTNVILL